MLDTSELFDAIGGNRGHWNTEHDQNIIDRLRFDDSLNVPIELTDADLWANYINEDLYVMDSKVRQLLKKTRWKREQKGHYRTTVSLVFAWIYGRQPEAQDSWACRMLHELMRYYCSTYIDNTTYMGKKVSRVYEFTRYAFNKRRPYSLKLRLEESSAGKDVWRKSPIDDTKKRRHGRRKHSEACVDEDR